MIKKNNSKVLALKYRPKIFKDLIGQDVIAETILNAIKIGKTPNAYLLTGIRGVGKTTTARLIAKALNCEKNDNENYLCVDQARCNHCEEIENSNHIDVLEMDAASKTGIDDIRELIENSKYNPTSAKFKVFIIDEVHMLSKQAFNGMLKTLEEPPQKLKFILATTEARKIPITILSRCQRFDLRRVTLDKIFNHLKEILTAEKGNISDDALKILSRASEGSVRDSISLLDRAIVFQSLNPNQTLKDTDVRKMLGLADKSKLINLLSNIFQGNENESLQILRGLIDDGLDAKIFLNDILELIYLIMRRVNLGPIEKDLFISNSELELIETVSKGLKIQDLGLFWQLTLKAIEDLNIVSNQNLALEMYVMQLIHVDKIDEKSPEENQNINNNNQDAYSDKKILSGDSNLKSSNIIKNQLKNIDQVKNLSKIDLFVETNNFKEVIINSFSDLIKVAEINKEMELKYDLERNVRLSKFENGKIEINFNENLNKNFIKRLSQSLLKWTGKRWIISLSKDDNLKTFAQKKIEKKEETLKEEEKSEVFKEIKKNFPDVNLIEVYKNDE